MKFTLGTRQKAHSQLGVGNHDDKLCVVRVLNTTSNHPVVDVYTCQPKHKIADIFNLPELAKRYAIKRAPCIGVMSPNTYQLLLIEAPPVPDSELRSAVRWKVQDLIDFHIDDAIVDVFELPVKTGDRKMVYVAIAQKSVVSTQVDKLIDTGFNLRALDIPELSLRNITRLLPEDKQGVALFWLTEESGLLTLTKDNQLYLARKIEVGINHLVNLLREQPIGVDLFEMPNDVTHIVDQIVVEIQRSLDYYESHFNQTPIQHLRLAPFPHEMPGLTEYLTLHLGIDVQWLDLNDIFVMHTPLDKAEQAQYLPMLGAALRREEGAK